jgi:hypothetical protein
MTRRRRRSAGWMLLAAFSIPAVPAVFAAQAEGPVAEEATSDEAAAPAPGPADRPAAGGKSSRPAAKGQAKPATSRPAARAKQRTGEDDSAGNAAPAATRPTRELSAEDMLSQMLKPPASAGGSRPLPPLPESAGGGPDKTSGRGAVAPAAPVVNVLREGTFLVDRVGRIERSADGSRAEFVFESDGTALQDPPVVIVPNLKLMQMEDAAANSTRDLRFRVSGMVTEYRGRNYVLLEKVVVVPEVLERF